MDKKKRQLVLFMGINGFPFGSAGVNYSSFICKAIQESGYDVLILTNKAVHNITVPVSIEKQGFIQGVKYRYTTRKVYREESFFKRNFEKIYGRINEIFLIIFFKLKGELKSTILYLPTNSFYDLLIYRLVTKLIFTPLVLIQNEYFSEINRNIGKFKKYQDKLFDKYSYYFTDKYILISEYLISKIFNNRKNKPYLKIPPLVHPGLFNVLKE